MFKWFYSLNHWQHFAFEVGTWVVAYITLAIFNKNNSESARKRQELVMMVLLIAAIIHSWTVPEPPPIPEHFKVEERLKDSVEKGKERLRYQDSINKVETDLLK